MSESNKNQNQNNIDIDSLFARLRIEIRIIIREELAKAVREIRKPTPPVEVGYRY